MNRLQSAWQGWVHLLEHREPATALAFLRIAMGLVLLFEMASVWSTGLIDVLWLRPEHGGYRNYTTTGSWLVDLLGGPEPAVIYGLVGLNVAAGLALVMGVASRLAALVGLQAFLAIAWTNGHTGGSYDPLITNLLWLLVLADSGSTGSLTALRRTGSWWPNNPVPAWPRYLVMGQMVAIYCSTGLQKVSASWVPGGDLSALYYILQQPSWQITELHFVAWVYPLTQAATLVTWCFEVFSPLLILAMWFRYTHARPGRLRAWSNRRDLRSVWLLVGVFLHLGIMMTMKVGTFSVVCLATYPCFFHADELRRFPGLRRWLQPPSPGGTASPQSE